MSRIFWLMMASTALLAPAGLGGCDTADDRDGGDAAQQQSAAIEQQMRRVDDPDDADDPTQERLP